MEVVSKLEHTDMNNKIAINLSRYKKLMEEMPSESLQTFSVVVHIILLVPSLFIFIFIGFFSIRKYTTADHFEFLIDAVNIITFKQLATLLMLYIMYNVNPLLVVIQKDYILAVGIPIFGLVLWWRQSIIVQWKLKVMEENLITK